MSFVLVNVKDVYLYLLAFETLLFYSRTMQTICLFFLPHFTASLGSPRILIVSFDSQRSQIICADIWLGTAQLPYFYSVMHLQSIGMENTFTALALCLLEHDILLMAVYFLYHFLMLWSHSSLCSPLSQIAAVHITVCMKTAILLRKEWGGAVVGRRGQREKERKEKRMKQWITVTAELIHAGSPAAMFCYVLLVWFSKHYSEAPDPTCYVSAPSLPKWDTKALDN